MLGQGRLVDAVLEDNDDGGGEGGPADVNEDPYGAVLWPAAYTVAAYVSRGDFTAGERERRGAAPCLLELGTGTGLVALAAAACGGYASVLATDYEAMPLKLLGAALTLNEAALGDAPVRTSRFDICDAAAPLPPGDVVCAADVLYEARTGRALAGRVAEALHRGSRVVVGCSPGRPGRPAFVEELRRLLGDEWGDDVGFADVDGTTCTGERDPLICGEGSSSISDEPETLVVALMDLGGPADRR